MNLSTSCPGQNLCRQLQHSVLGSDPRHFPLWLTGYGCFGWMVGSNEFLAGAHLLLRPPPAPPEAHPEGSCPGAGSPICVRV